MEKIIKTSTITIRPLTTMEELLEMQKVEEVVWQMSPNPVHQTFTALNNGGIILGAFDGNRMIGFLYSFAGFDGQNAYLCSHMLGILSAYRSGGLGMRMKRKQAEMAGELGYSIITWTFDPLESLNAYLNLHKLGAVGAAYHIDHYGTMNDNLNKGLPSDRIQIEWSTVEQEDTPPVNFAPERLLTDIDEHNKPLGRTAIFHDDHDGWFVAIPANFQSIKKENIELARSWRLVTRKAFQLLFNHEYVAVDLLHNPSKKISYYYFSK
ncbi:GNAT family N-acetyltransferase [Virgibacillus ihumii]|uniref:GNAT family N-acetyltransferase n=1 Tax=Virgibacillus ihumii TaxID=2686091 RepID=UPI00157D9108|nr:GNAT family N-acetyltransferase [Virgibacillus ihumii]